MRTGESTLKTLPAGFLSDAPSRDGALRWYAVHVPEGREDAVARKCRQLLDSNVLEDCFVPKYEKYLKREGAWRIVTNPLFSEYVFVSTRDVRALAQALGRLSFPAPIVGRQGGTFTPLSSSVQAALESLLDEGRVLRASEGRIEDGVLKVEHGPLCGHEAEVRAINRHKRMAYVQFGKGGEDFVLRAALNVYQKS